MMYAVGAGVLNNNNNNEKIKDFISDMFGLMEVI